MSFSPWEMELDVWGFLKGVVCFTRVYINRLILLQIDASDANINMTQGRPFLRELSHRWKTFLLLWTWMGICPNEVRLEICMFMTLDSIRSHIHNIHAGKNSLNDSKNNNNRSKHDLKIKSFWATLCFFNKFIETLYYAWNVCFLYWENLLTFM